MCATLGMLLMLAVPISRACSRFCRVAWIYAGGELSPADPNLLVQQGGTLLLRGNQTLWRHNDSGILKYTDIYALLAAAEEAVGGGA